MKRKYNYTVNGLETTAVYDDCTVEQIFFSGTSKMECITRKTWKTGADFPVGTSGSRKNYNRTVS